MAKYLLSYDEQDVKNGKLDVSPDGILKSAGNGETVLPYVYHAVRKSPFFSQHPEGDWGNRRIKRLCI